jgi:hypothetical protein
MATKKGGKYGSGKKGSSKGGRKYSSKGRKGRTTGDPGKRPKK